MSDTIGRKVTFQIEGTISLDKIEEFEAAVQALVNTSGLPLTFRSLTEQIHLPVSLVRPEIAQIAELERLISQTKQRIYDEVWQAFKDKQDYCIRCSQSFPPPSTPATWQRRRYCYDCRNKPTGQIKYCHWCRSPYEYTTFCRSLPNWRRSDEYWNFWEDWYQCEKCEEDSPWTRFIEQRRKRIEDELRELRERQTTLMESLPR